MEDFANNAGMIGDGRNGRDHRRRGVDSYQLRSAGQTKFIGSVELEGTSLLFFSHPSETRYALREGDTLYLFVRESNRCNDACYLLQSASLPDLVAPLLALGTES